jgi:hypothetical protein
VGGWGEESVHLKAECFSPTLRALVLNRGFRFLGDIMKIITILFILSMLVPSAAAQVSTKKLLIIYKDGGRVELSNWYWYYVDDTTPGLIGLEETRIAIGIGPSGPPKKPKKKDSKSKDSDYTKTSNNLFLSMNSLNARGIQLNDLELSETQFNSIKFIWKDKGTNVNEILDRVVVTLADGRTVELPRLEPSTPYSHLFLKGVTRVNGFEGNFSKEMNFSATPIGEAANAIIEIKIQ